MHGPIFSQTSPNWMVLDQRGLSALMPEEPLEIPAAEPIAWEDDEEDDDDFLDDDDDLDLGDEEDDDFFDDDDDEDVEESEEEIVEDE